MEEEDINDNIQFDQDNVPMNLQDDPSIALKHCYDKTFNFLPPSFEELFSLDSGVLEFVNSMLELLNAGKYSPLTKDSVQQIHLGIRALLQSLKSSAVHEINEHYEQSRKSLQEMKEKYDQSQEELKTAQNTISNLKSELEDANNDKTRLSKLNIQQKKDFNIEIQKYKTSYHDISDKYDDAVAKVKLLTGIEDRLKNQLQLAQAEADGYAQQSEKLSNTLTEKKDKIYQLKVELKKASITISDLQTQLSSASKTTPITHSPTNTNDQSSRLALQEQRNQQQMYEYRSKIEAQTLEIKALKDNNKELSEKLEEITTQNADKDSQLKQSVNQIERLTTSLKETQQQMEKTSDRLAKSEEELSNKTLEHNQFKDIIAKVTELVSETYNVDSPNSIPAIVEEIIAEQNDSDVSQRLISTIDALTRFILQYLLRDKIDDKVLVQPLQALLNHKNDETTDPVEPITKDRKLFNEATRMITELRDAINQDFGGSIDQYRMFDSLLSAREMFLEDKDNCEFAALNVLCAANEKLRRACIEQKKTIDTFNKVFPINYLADTRKLFQSISKATQQYYKQNFGDNMQLLTYFVNNTIDLLSKLRNEVIPKLDKHCEILDLPDLIINYIHELGESIMKEATENTQLLSQEQQTLRNDLLKSQTLLDTTREEKQYVEKQNRKLSAKLAEIIQKNTELQQQLDETKLTQVDLETTFTTVKEVNEGHEETIRALKQERDVLQDALKRRVESAQIRCDTVIAAEREAHLKEIQRTEKLHLEDKKHMMDEMQKKENRFKAIRAKDKELIELLENQIKKLQQGDNLSVSSVQSVHNDILYQAIVKEISRCVQTGGEWTQQKVINAVKKIVDKVLISSTDEQWRLWGSKLIGNDDQNLKPSIIRRNIEQLISSMKNTNQNNQTLIDEKKILVKFGNEQLNSSSTLSIKGLAEAMLFSAIAKKISASKLKPRKSYI